MWTDASSRTFKENFDRVDPEEVLAKVSALPVRSWNYKGVPGVRHIGPVAEDFREMFSAGEDEKYLASLDTSGVALVAIQGLNEAAAEKDRKILNQDRRIRDLEERLARVEEMLLEKDE